MKARFNPRASLIIIPARIFGPAGDATVRMALDTGATSTVLRNSTLALLGYAPAAAEHRVQVTTGSGIEYPARLTVQRIESLGFAQTQFSVLALPLQGLQVDGLLGLDYLRGRRLAIDFRTGELSLT